LQTGESYDELEASTPARRNSLKVNQPVSSVVDEASKLKTNESLEIIEVNEAEEWDDEEVEEETIPPLITMS